MRDPLLSLAPTELRDLAASIRTGRLATPFSSIKMARFLGGAPAAVLANRLESLAELGMSGSLLATCLEMAADALDSRKPLEDAIDLVTTGPEAGGVANRSTAVVVDELFRGARTSVLIAGYAIYQGQKIFHTLAQGMMANPTLSVRMFLDVPRHQGDSSAASNQIARFVHEFKTIHWPASMPLPTVYCCEQFIDGRKEKAATLHAKCVVADHRRVFISSANFTQAAQERNIEVGLLLESTIIAERLTQFFETLADNHTFVRVL